MEETIREFLDHLEHTQERSQNTLIAYKYDLEQFRIVNERMRGASFPLEELGDEDLISYLEWLQARNYRQSTIARKWAAVRSYLEFAKQQDYVIDKSLGDRITYLPSERQHPQVLTRQEVYDMLNAPLSQKNPLGTRDSAILSVMYRSGLRAGEMIALQIDHVDLENGTLHASWCREFPTYLGAATERIRTYLLEGRPHLARIPEERTLFLNQRGTGLTRQGLWLIVKRWAMEAGLGDKISPQTLRHSLTKHMLESGYSKKQVQAMLGLRSPNSIRVFLSSKD
ncbi:MAG: tyrosine-type recombinase/integrase [Anaerolineales bacterium]|nr:tyrosine-type recombinase/integrase [Anaerolineales bacterium]